MTLRVIGYDGAFYRSQIMAKRPKPMPVVTLVLYFGTDRKWTQPMSLKEVLMSEEGEEVKTMCDVAERLVNKGRLEGRLEGQLEGENKLAQLMRALLSTGRTEDAQKVASDGEARKKFYREFGIID